MSISRSRRRCCPAESVPGPLPAHRLAEIWRGLPEHERLGFVLALDESICYAVIEITATHQEAQS